jgi:hypothetical protein
MARKAYLLLALSSVLMFCQTANADILRSLLLALDYARFDTFIGPNPVSGGGELETSRTFIGETLDFGVSELSLRGPVEFSFNTGDRFIDTMNLSLNTRGQPLFYTWTTDVGGQQMTREGSLFLDATGDLNEFGWYQLQFDYSVRETVTESGRFSNEETPVEFDIGPIDVRGNLYADFLAVLMDPVFAALGVENVFASFSGRVQAEEEFARRMADTTALTGDFPLVSGLGFAELLDDPRVLASGEVTASSVGLTRTITETGTVTIAAPDPTTVLLLMAGVPFVWRSARRRH